MITDYSSAIEKYTPSSEERKKLSSISDKARDFIDSYCSSEGIDADAVLVGSVAKGTNLKGADLDLFIRFDRKYSRKEMETLGLDIGHKVLSNGIERYAEHPYVTGFMEGVKLDLVPCYRILPGQKKVSSVDRTPLHTEYVKTNLDRSQLSDVLLLKVFAKSIGVYGSEVTTSGFSGYICEILVIEYGSFVNVLKTFAGWKGNFKLGKNEYVGKFRDPVIIIDPVDDDRNAAAAISRENLSRMILASKLFLKGKEKDFFNLERPMGPFKRDDRGTAIRIFSVPRPDLIDDVIYPQALRMKNSICSILEREGFEPMDSEVEVSDRVRILIECRRDRPPAFVLHRGPPVDSDNVLDFIETWKHRYVLRGPYIKEDRLYIDLKGGRKSIEEAVLGDIGPLNIGKSLNKYKREIGIESPDLSAEDPLLQRFLARGLF